MSFRDYAASVLALRVRLKRRNERLRSNGAFWLACLAVLELGETTLDDL
jgi:hypothetical protein